MKIILVWILGKWGVRVWNGPGPVAGSCEDGDKPVGFISGRGFLDKLSHYQLLKKVYTHETRWAKQNVFK
jgi:hypothetical protein